MDWLIQAAQLILSLSILIVLHEMGHFVPAKLFKTRVEKFYLFFDPWFSLFKIKKGETEYGIGWLPGRFLHHSQSRLVSAGEAHWHVPMEIRLYRCIDNNTPDLVHFWEKIRESFIDI